MKTLIESGWPQGWNPSAADKGDPSGQNQQLLRMDNLTQEEKGVLRLARYNNATANDFNNSNVYSIFSTILNNLQVRFVYVDNGSDKSLMRTSGDIHDFDTFLITQSEASKRCDFLNTLGHVFMVAGDIQQKFDGVLNFPIGIPAPAAPTLVANATNIIDLNNLDGGGDYTNWTSITSATFDNSSTEVSGTGATTGFNYNFNFETTFGSPIDITDLGGVGKDTPDDIFTFQFKIADASQLYWFKITLFTTLPAPYGGDYYWFEWDFPQTNTTYPSFPISSDVSTPVTLKRSQFYKVGAPDWASITNIRIEIGVLDVSAVIWSGFTVQGGKDSVLTGTFNYVAVEVNDTGAFLEFSPASPTVSGSTTLGNITLTPAGAVNAQSNQYWLFRQDIETGVYYFVGKQVGARGFTPSTITDTSLVEDLVTAANINPQYTLQYLRTALPTDIISMIWFRDRIIYLTSDAFIPSYSLDPGSYDSRFKYELAGNNSEKCLFIAKLDVGTFIIATTKDFYRITGTFSIQTDPNDPTGQVQYQDVTITPLGISDPAISRAYVEYQQTLIYVSSTGIRVLSNATSTLINNNLELLFRGEARYDFPAIALEPNDNSIIAAASRGNLIYFSLPHTDGINRLYVLTLNSDGVRNWLVVNSSDNSSKFMCLYREDDGTVIGGGPVGATNYIRAIGVDTFSNFDVVLKTQFNYGGNPLTRKDGLIFETLLNTGNNPAQLVLLGLKKDGSVINTIISITANGLTKISVDIKKFLEPCVAYAILLACTTNLFEMQWFAITYEERPLPVKRAIIYPSNFDKPNLKEISVWPFTADPLGGTIVANVVADGAATIPGELAGNGPLTGYWFGIEPRAAINWGIELVSETEFEFYKFHSPDIQQIYPIARRLDQLGPIDLNATGLIFGARFRVMGTKPVQYLIYANDVQVYVDWLDEVSMVDQTFIVKFPKGIDPSVVKIVLKSDAIFYRFSVELHVRLLGKESENKFIMVADVNTK